MKTTGDQRAGPHAETALVLQLAALGIWLVEPTLEWAVLAAVLAVAAAVLAPKAGRRSLTLMAVLGVAGAIVALSASWRVREVERRWRPMREELIGRASRRLGNTLKESVALARRLADRGAGLAGTSQAGAFAALEREASSTGGAVEAGVVVLDANGQPWSWAGRHRLPVERSAPAELYARMTAFYVVLEARRQSPDGRYTAVGQVLLAADSAVPDGKGSVAAVFSRATGSRVEFFAPGRGPLDSDVFDYCIPSCDAGKGARPDTLFAVRTSPPAQGAFKLRLIGAGTRAAAWVLAASLMGLLLLGQPGTRYASLGLAAALLVLTLAGRSAGLGSLFSPVPYYLDLFGPLTRSAGALIVSGAAMVIVLVWLWPRRAPPAVAWLAAAVGILAPVGAWLLAGGITPPPSGARIGLWLEWEVGIALGASALTLLAAWALHGVRLPRRSWFAAAAVAWGIGAAASGLSIWQPGVAWPWWIATLWIPAVLLAALAGSPTRQILSGALVAGSAAALFTWGAVVDGRLALARADAHRLGDSHDPVTLAMLERLGQDIGLAPSPRSPAELYRRWSRTPLDDDGYPAVLTTWEADGRMVASLALADLDLPPALVQAEARGAATRRAPGVVEFGRVPGVHVLLSAPTADGRVVTVGVGPRSRLLPPFRVARFLRGEGAAPPPYELSLSEPTSGDTLETFRWRREAGVVRGEAHIELPGGPRHLHVIVDLGGPGALLVRGALLLVLDLAVVFLLWGLAEAMAGRSGVRARLMGMVRPASYRLRLAIALSVFFIVPTVGFAAWMGGRLQSDAARQRDLVTRQALRDATGSMAEAGGGPVSEVLPSVASRVGADLVWYASGVLADASSPLLPAVGLIDPYLPPDVYRALLLNDALELTTTVAIAGRPTRVGYRSTAAGGDGPAGVLAGPRLMDEVAAPGDADLAYALLLVTLLGLGAAAWLAGVAARSLARPVGALRAAADAVGRGEMPTPLHAAVPEEFASVSDAFTRMAVDVRASQAALEGARQRTAAVLRHVATGVVGLSRDLRVSVANPRAEQVLGVTLSPDASVREGTSAAWADVWTWIEGFLASGRGLDDKEFTIGGRRILAQVSTLGAEAGGCVVALDDVTDLAHAVRVLAWGEMARQVAHEIKNPLTPLRLGVQHLQRAYRGARGEFEGVLDHTSKQILTEIDRLDAVARAFARFGTPGTEQQAGPLEPVDLVDVAKETAALYTLGAETRVTVSGDGVTAPARRDELKEVLVNLLENARNAGATTVELVARKDGAGRVALDVRDNGRGIPAVLLPRVFEPHFSTTTSGTGLGLAICKRLVESWGGSIDVHSEEGRGTTVTVRMSVN